MENNNTKSNKKRTIFTVLFWIWFALPFLGYTYSFIFGKPSVFGSLFFVDNFFEKIVIFIFCYFMALIVVIVRYFLVAVAYWIILAILHKYMIKPKREITENENS